MNQSFYVPVGALKSPSLCNVTVDLFSVKVLLCWDPLVILGSDLDSSRRHLSHLNLNLNLVVSLIFLLKILFL